MTGLDDKIFVFWMLSFKPDLSVSSLTLIKQLFGSSLLSAVKSGIICISEVIDISLGNHGSGLWFILSGISHDVLHVEVK